MTEISVEGAETEAEILSIYTQQFQSWKCIHILNGYTPWLMRSLLAQNPGFLPVESQNLTKSTAVELMAESRGNTSKGR